MLQVVLQLLVALELTWLEFMSHEFVDMMVVKHFDALLPYPKN